jgi:predicted AAA+ superfamily ATPase
VQCDCIFYPTKELVIKIQRKISSHPAKLATQFPVVAVVGPRQAGKTTLVKDVFPTYVYVSLNDTIIRTQGTIVAWHAIAPMLEEIYKSG